MPDVDPGVGTAADLPPADGRAWLSADLVGGLLAMALAGFVLAESAHYGRGTVLRMGPGLFPTALGSLLLLLGGGLAFGGLRRGGEPIARPRWRSLAFVALGLLLFATVLPRFGLGPAIVLLVAGSAPASPMSRPGQTVLLAAALTGFAWFVFVWLLSLPLPMLTW